MGDAARGSQAVGVRRLPSALAPLVQAPARSAAVLALVLAVALVAGLVVAWAGSGDPGLQVRNGRITWLAPDGPAWNKGFTIDDRVIQYGQTWTAHPPHGPPVVLSPRDLALPALSAALVALGLLILGMGTLVLLRANERPVAWRFFWLSLTAAVALGLLGPTIRGYWWALAGQEVVLRLFGPSFLALAFAFPPALGDGRSRRWIWVPALALLPAYALCWVWPAALFSLVGTLDLLLLAAYLLVGAALFVRAARRPLPPVARVQLQLLAGGLLLGLAPFVFGSLLPTLFTGQSLVPGEISIMALVLLPLALAVAILSTEFLGITSIVHRRPLRLSLALAGMAAVGLAAWGAERVGQMHGWSPGIAAATAAIGGAFIGPPAYRLLVRACERLFMRDAYDLGAALLTLSTDLSTGEAEEIGQQALARLDALLDLSFAVLVEPERTLHRVHPRSTIPEALIQAVIAAGQAAAWSDPAMITDTDAPRLQAVAGLPILFLPVRGGAETLAMLCLGPKRSGDHYTREDQALLGTLARYLGVLLSNSKLRTQLAGQVVLLRAASAERLVVAERVLTAVAEERRHLGELLYSQAIPVARSLLGGTADDLRPEAARDALALLERIAGDLAPIGRATPGLSAALRGLVRDTQRRTSIACWGNIAAVQVTLAEQAAIYQVAREAIANAVSHAQATRITLDLHQQGHDLVLRVLDDGCGFTQRLPAELLAANKTGLLLMHEQARELGGQLQVTSKEGYGTQVELILPTRALADRAATDLALQARGRA